MKETTEQDVIEQLLRPYNYGAFYTDKAESAMWLYATFDINLPEAILVEGEPGEPISLGVNLEGYDAEVQLTLNPRLGRVKKSNEGRWYYGVNQVSVTISRHADLPDDVADKDEFFKNELMPEYQQAAIEAANRMAAFLRYRLWSSLFSAIEHFMDDYGDPENPKALQDISTSPRFHIQGMSDEFANNLQDYVGENYSNELAEVFLEQAQDSIINKRTRRACLELTMACESFVKKRIPTAGQLVDAIDGGFKSRHQAAYIDLNGLFQARDDARKKSEGFFNFSSQAKRTEAHEHLMTWGASVICLKQWVCQAE